MEFVAIRLPPVIPVMGQSNPALKKRIDVADLQVGMYICELDRPWLETPFVLQGFQLRSNDDIEAVRSHCDFVFVDVGRSGGENRRRVREPGSTQLHADRNTSKARSAAGSSEVERKRGLLAKLGGRGKSRQIRNELQHPIRQAERAVSETTRVISGILDDVRLGRAIDAPQAKEVVSNCVDQVIENPSAMMLLTNLKEKDHYTSQHCLNVAILSIVLGQKCGLPRDKLELIGLCGMLHDVGKLLTPDHVLNKPGRLDRDEILIMKMHPTQGRDILLSSDGIASTALDVAHGHHERFNGGGYPRGLSEEQIGFHTRIVAIADTFDAITSDRVYGKARTSIEALKILQSAGGTHYDGDLVSHFLDAVGVFPPGSVVQLSNDEIAVVVRANSKLKLAPKVLVMKNSKGQPMTPRYLDLAEQGESNGPKLHIARMVKAEDFGVDIHLFRNPGFLEALAD